MTICLYRAILPVLTLVLVALGGTVFRTIQWKRIRLTDFFVLAIAVSNGVCYLFVLLAAEEGLIYPWFAAWIHELKDFEWLYPTLSIIAIFGVWSGEIILNSLRLRKVEAETSAVMTGRTVLGLPKWLPWTFLMLGLVTYWLYARAYGGFARLLTYSELIRAGLFAEIGIVNPLSFLQRFGGLGILAAWMFAGHLLSAQSRRERIVDLVGFGVASLFSVYVLFTWKGRLAFILFFAVIFLGVWIHRRGLTLRSIITALALVLGVMAAAIPLVTSLLDPDRGARSTIELFAKELSFPVVSFSAALDTPGIRGMQDLALWPLFFLPERIWRLAWGVDTVSIYNTRMLMGAPKGEGGVTGGIPVDFVTFGYLQAGVIGIILWSLLWGLALGWLNRLLMELRPACFWSFFYAFAGLSVAAMTTLYSDPEHIIERNLYFIIGCAIIMFMKPRVRSPRQRPINSIPKHRTCASC